LDGNDSKPPLERGGDSEFRLSRKIVTIPFHGEPQRLTPRLTHRECRVDAGTDA
jgi:hypothetical protein